MKKSEALLFHLSSNIIMLAFSVFGVLLPVSRYATTCWLVTLGCPILTFSLGLLYCSLFSLRALLLLGLSTLGTYIRP
ncbi:hypothetical protein B0F90DRAFT_1751839 [Multifurca ochricompacta]|uniref:Uncharacterized protein n=1 Tax=Multifurca ochricompacta TaxID=376703 RepID=A0AAD4QJQ4_9AGAM|nr:hypothetical protein B0F90DRAFT_1751839 [Multifurca ochricompacta]